jgi:hypothetical protein
MMKKVTNNTKIKMKKHTTTKKLQVAKNCKKLKQDEQNLSQLLEMIAKLKAMQTMISTMQPQQKGRDVFSIRCVEAGEYLVQAKLEEQDAIPVAKIIMELIVRIKQKMSSQMSDHDESSVNEQIEAVANTFAKANRELSEPEFRAFVAEMQAHAEKLRGGR